MIEITHDIVEMNRLKELGYKLTGAMHEKGVVTYILYKEL